MNPCQTGNEPQGNMLKVESFNGTAASVIFAGGTPKDHVMPKGIAIPAAIQASAIVRPSGAESAPSPFTKTRYSVADLTISERSIKNVLILKLEGKLTKAAGTTAVQDAIRDSLGHGKKNILIDLKGITYVEDGALGVLIDGNAANIAAGGKVKMLDPSEAFQKASMIMEFLDAYSTYDKEDEALASFE
jgi:anti-sigma B factor antagonist